MSETNGAPKSNNPRARRDMSIKHVNVGANEKPPTSSKSETEIKKSRPTIKDEAEIKKTRPTIKGETANPVSDPQASDFEARGRHINQVQDMSESVREKKRARLLKRFATGGIAAVIVIVLACFGFMGLQQNNQATTPAINAFDATSDPATTFDNSKVNPIDFNALMTQNKDVYAWIFVPGTDVNYPILQSSLADNYYLYHNINGEDDPKGAIYTQSVNSKNFSDPVTVVYGHTFQVDDERANDAFGTLHNYEDESFMKEHPDIYIYTPDYMLTYKVVSAYVYDNRHILNTLDIYDEAVRQEYYDSVVNPTGEIAVTSDIDSLDPKTDRIIQLSTCTRPSISENRFIVTGVLTDKTELDPCW